MANLIRRDPIREMLSQNRTISMPGSVDIERIQAETDNGVLQIHLPKKEEVKPRRIEIKGESKQNVIEGKSKK